MHINDDNMDDVFSNLNRSDLEDEQINFPTFNKDKDGYIAPLVRSYLYVRGKDDISDYGPHEFFILDEDDDVIGFARSTKNPLVISFNLVWIEPEYRGLGIASSLYEYFLDQGIDIKSDDEITDATEGLYRSLINKGYFANVENGRIILSSKDKIQESFKFDRVYQKMISNYQMDNHDNL
jgi:GNAT superfamily N-acetyltransferase